MTFLFYRKVQVIIPIENVQELQVSRNINSGAGKVLKKSWFYFVLDKSDGYRNILNYWIMIIYMLK